MFPWRTFVLAANNVRGEHCSRGGHLFARRTVSAANNCPYGYNGEQLFAANKFFAIICPPRTVFVRQTAVRRRTSWRTSSRRSSSEYARSPSESARSSSESGGRSANVRRTLPEFAKNIEKSELWRSLRGVRSYSLGVRQCSRRTLFRRLNCQYLG